MNCPICGKEMYQVIYMGFPMWLCSDNECNVVMGFWSFLVEFWFNGFFYKYKDSYFRALIRWLKSG